MKLLVLRHGEAEYSAPNSHLDSDRRLTSRGRVQVQGALGYLQQKSVLPDWILVSPYVRTQQSAEYLTQAFPDAVVETWPELVPESYPERLCERLQALPADKVVVLVSHQPLVSHLLSYLTGDAPNRYPMGTASLACVNTEVVAASLAEFHWLQHAE